MFMEHNNFYRSPTGDVQNYNDFFSKGHGALFLGTLAYVRDVWNEVGGYERVSRGEDIRFIEKALKQCVPLLNIHDVPNVYVRHNNTLKGAHNTWLFNKIEQHLMYDYVHRVERPGFLSEQTFSQMLAAEQGATALGSCAAPSEPAAEFVVKYFPEMPEECCSNGNLPSDRQGLGCEKSGESLKPSPEALKSAATSGVASLNDDFNEATYQKVVELRKNGKMGQFIRSLLTSVHASVTDQKAFAAFIPDYSGVKGSQTFASLVSALRVAPFVSDGAALPPLETAHDAEAPALTRIIEPASSVTSASGSGLPASPKGPISSASDSEGEFTEAEYQKVASLKKNGEMGAFIRRYLASIHSSVADPVAFAAFVPKFSGTKGIQSFDLLVAALKDAPFVKGSTAVPTTIDVPLHPLADGNEAQEASPSANGLQASDVSPSLNAIPARPDEDTRPQAPASSSSVDLTGEFNEAGYQKVVAMHKNGKMGEFIRRLLASVQASVKDQQGFANFVPYYSGVKESKTFYTLVNILQVAPFVEGGKGLFRYTQAIEAALDAEHPENADNETTVANNEDNANADVAAKQTPGADDAFDPPDAATAVVHDEVGQKQDALVATLPKDLDANVNADVAAKQTPGADDAFDSPDATAVVHDEVGQKQSWTEAGCARRVRAKGS
eukprot:TRINITY_DN6820_c0_g1_i35.p1 TRINITY_DN6820_c0_g1~~TRINITY_DN6820_c0_g1_i35.p1  ORF type:complete len:668 (-),score=84.20 TRINITY_DN6820_c0_g1_i35:411-2414(-)